MKPDLAAFVDLIEVDVDGPEVTSDPFSKFLESTTLAGTISGPHAHRLVHNFQIEASERSKPIAAAYRKIAEAAAPKVAPAESSRTLAKRFSSDEKAGYRKYFQEQTAAGKAASAVLAEWNSEFPNANPSIAKLMTEVASEFQ